MSSDKSRASRTSNVSLRAKWIRISGPAWAVVTVLALGVVALAILINYMATLDLAELVRVFHQ